MDSSVTQLPWAWAPPEEVDEYRLLRPIGVGAGGSVYLAQDTLLDRPVAVKFLPAGDKEGLSRFLSEARAAARIQHPNVATLYRVGQIADRAYLVSEFIRGTSLDKLDRPVAWRRALEIGIGLARGLAAAHRRGVLHRDIKPANAVLADDGTVKLVDFGVAQLQDASLQGKRNVPQPGGGGTLLEPVGTPYFMSPEAWGGTAMSARSDLYSLGAVLYELCAGQGPNRDVAAIDLAQVVQDREVRPLSLVVPGADRKFAAVIDRCLRRDPAARYGSAEELLDALEQFELPRGREQVPEGNPYRGLRAFDAEHRAVFFGRRRERAAALDRLRSEAAVLVSGDSGVGKSSLCLAAVLPALRDGALGGGRSWTATMLVPGRHPLTALAEVLAPTLDLAVDFVERLLHDDPERAVRMLRQQLGAARGLAVFVDQLEELTTVSVRAEAEHAARALGEIGSGSPNLRLLGTARSDSLGRLAELSGLGDLIPRALLFLRGMAADQVREAILGPARMKGVKFETDALVQSLTDWAVSSEGSLPLLQFTLTELWEARDVEAGVISSAALDHIGGVTGALTRHADGVLEPLLPEQREAARRILMRLVTPEGTRARRSSAELTGTDPRAQVALEALVRGRLLVAAGEAVEIAHEALVKSWSTLWRWLSEEVEHRAVRARLENAAEEWERAARRDDSLWNAGQLADAAVLEESTLSPRERAFLREAKRKVFRERLLRRGAVVGFAVSIALAVVGSRLKTRLDVNKQVAAQLASARSSTQEAHASAVELDKARAESFRLFDSRKRAAGEKAWSRALQLAAAVETATGNAMEKFEQALVLDPGRADVASDFGDFLLERARRAEREHRISQRDELTRRMRLYDADGRRWQAWNAPAKLSIESDPPGAEVELSRIEADASGHRRPVRVGSLGRTPIAAADLENGSYLLVLRQQGRTDVSYPVSLERGEARKITVPLPVAVPAGFAFVPAGRFLFGTAAGEGVREYFNTVPVHAVETGAYLIAKHETTYGEWIDFLRSLPRDEKERRSPHVGAVGLSGQLDLIEVLGRWQLTLQAGAQTHRVHFGESLAYPGRSAHATQNWLRLPVAGISFHDAKAYTAWLARTGRVPRARLCTEREWERAARGADDREFPSGDALAPEDANFDLTYGKTAAGFGPDEVGLHPGSRSPFGVDDLAGNVWEWAESSLGDSEAVARGGSYYTNAYACHATNREVPEPSFRAMLVGMRVCASVAK
ncbi:MAG TPA: SUMF1/EgtB/PvdO family nonheme iron enzyme [Myxococcales bacterium]